MKLELKNISKKFSKKTVIENISFTLESGEILCIVGRNASGKTTLFKIISGIYKQSSGTITIDNKKLCDNENLMSKIIYIPDKFDYFKFSKIKKMISYYKLLYKNFDENYFKQELVKNNIDINKKFSQISKGQSMLVGIILGLACKTDFLILDEPLDGIDVINIKEIIDYILEAQDRGVGILISSHRLDYVENIGDKIIYLDNNEKSEQVIKDNYCKYQVVCEDKLPENILQDERVKIVSNIGRVYTLVVKSTSQEFEKVLQESGVLQFDRLNITLEDIFVLKDKGGE